jgi:hypothetical protein
VNEPDRAIEKAAANIEARSASGVYWPVDVNLSPRVEVVSITENANTYPTPELGFSFSVASASQSYVQPEPISVEVLYDGGRLEQPSPVSVCKENFSGQQISLDVETEVLLQEFDDLWTGTTDMRLGRLLLMLGIVSHNALEEAVSISAESSISVGRALVMSGHLKSAQVQWAVQIQALLRENVISFQKAKRIADLMSSEGMTLQRAFNCLGLGNPLEVLEGHATRIGDLLTESELISEEELEEALERANQFGLPIGRYLSISNVIAASLLESITNLQNYVREGRMHKADAVVAIRQSARRQYELKKKNSSEQVNHVPLQSIRIGQLLTLAGVVNEFKMDSAVEIGLRRNCPVGEVLVDSGYLTQITLESTLTLQQLLADGTLELIDAVYALVDVHHHGFTLSSALERNRKYRGERRFLSFEQFVESLELVSASQVEASIETARRSPSFVSKALVSSGVMTESTAQVALICHFYIREGMLTTEEAMLLCQVCNRTGLAIKDGIRELGLTVRARGSSPA